MCNANTGPTRGRTTTSTWVRMTLYDVTDQRHPAKKDRVVDDSRFDDVDAALDYRRSMYPKATGYIIGPTGGILQMVY